MERIKDNSTSKQVLDPRTKLIVLLMINIIVLVSLNILTELICISVIILSLMHMRAYAQVLRSMVMYAGMLGILYVCGLFPENIISSFLSMIAVCFRKIAPPLFFASGMIATTKVGELISAMQKLRIPKPVVITFAVTLRFFPAVQEEYTCIKDAMRLRGIGLSAGNVLAHPLRVVESVLIPMMMRCATIAEELSAAAVTRGIENDGKRTSITELRMRIFDWIVIAGFTVLTVFVMLGGLSV